MSSNSNVKLLEKELSIHDWNYEYSDDYQIWSKGQNHWKKIRDLSNQCSTEDVCSLLERYRPK